MKGTTWKAMIPGIIIICLIILISFAFLGDAQEVDLSQYFGIEPEFGEIGDLEGMFNTVQIDQLFYGNEEELDGVTYELLGPSPGGSYWKGPDTTEECRLMVELILSDLDAWSNNDFTKFNKNHILVEDGGEATVSILNYRKKLPAGKVWRKIHNPISSDNFGIIDYGNIDEEDIVLNYFIGDCIIYAPELAKIIGNKICGEKGTSLEYTNNPQCEIDQISYLPDMVFGLAPIHDVHFDCGPDMMCREILSIHYDASDGDEPGADIMDRRWVNSFLGKYLGQGGYSMNKPGACVTPKAGQATTYCCDQLKNMIKNFLTHCKESTERINGIDSASVFNIPENCEISVDDMKGIINSISAFDNEPSVKNFLEHNFGGKPCVPDWITDNPNNVYFDFGPDKKINNKYLYISYEDVSKDSIAICDNDAYGGIDNFGE